MADWTDWADGKDLAGMSRSTSPLSDAGYDVDELRANPDMRASVMKQAASPYGLQQAIQSAAGKVAPAMPAPQARPQPMQAPAQAPGQAQMQRPAQPPAQTQTSAQASPSGNPGGAAPPPSLDEMGRQALQRGMEVGQQAEQQAQQLSSSNGPDTVALEAQRAKDATATPYRDPQTGKVLDSAQQYAPTGWQRFGRGVKSAAVGFLTGGIPGGIVGAIEPEAIKGGTAYGAPNSAYNATESARQGRLASEDQQLGDAASRFKEMTDARKAGNTALNDASKADIGVAKDITQMSLGNQKNATALRKAGYTTDEQGNVTPIPYEQLSPDQQAHQDLEKARTEAASAQADLNSAKNDPNSAAYRQAQDRINVARQNAGTALQRLGLSAQEFGFNQDKFYDPQPTAAERGKKDLADSAVSRVQEMRNLVQKRPEIFGPGPGRAQRLETWLGSQDPDAQTFQSASQYLADHSAGIFGGRGQYILQQLHSLTDPKSNPAALNAALDEAERTAQGFVTAGTTHGRPTAPAGGGNPAAPSRPAAGGSNWADQFPEAQ